MNKELNELLNRYVATYDLDELGFRQSGQATLIRKIQALITKASTQRAIEELEKLPISGITSTSGHRYDVVSQYRLQQAIDELRRSLND